MKRISVDRLTEVLALLCVSTALITLTYSAGVPAADGSLAQLKVQTVADQDMAGFHTMLQEARRKVDSNRDPGQLLARLQESFPGRHEVWALTARHSESEGRDRDALAAYGRAVRLQPDYLDEKSGLYLGKRIETLTAKVMDDLRATRSSGELDRTGKELLKTAYFLKRRLAGGCE